MSNKNLPDHPRSGKRQRFKKNLRIGILLVLFAGLMIFLIPRGWEAFRAHQEKNWQSQAASMSKEVKQLYVDPKGKYFKADIERKDITALKKTLKSKNEQPFQTVKTAINQVLDDYALQQEINGLFESKALDGAVLDPAPVLKEKSSAEEIKGFRESLETNHYENTAWGSDLAALLSVAIAQQALKTDAVNTTAALFENNKVRAAVTLDAYTTAKGKVLLVKNAAVKNKLLGDLSEVENYLGQQAKKQDEEFTAKVAKETTELNEKIDKETKAREQAEKELRAYEEKKEAEKHAREAKEKADEAKRSSESAEKRSRENSSSTTTHSSTSTSTTTSSSASSESTNYDHQ